MHIDSLSPPHTLSLTHSYTQKKNTQIGVTVVTILSSLIITKWFRWLKCDKSVKNLNFQKISDHDTAQVYVYSNWSINHLDTHKNQARKEKKHTHTHEKK